jgi:hypothetical protein
VFPRKRHQMQHLCDLACFLAKQVHSQLSYTPTRCNQYTLNGLQPVLRLVELRIHIAEEIEACGVWAEVF